MVFSANFLKPQSTLVNGAATNPMIEYPGDIDWVILVKGTVSLSPRQTLLNASNL
ncbi:hypothetical protein HMPREF0497_0166 [Lentilactobacillus buchneri ATCC 11577]|nr:hypothetical protein HMPREF0497_0166 [Lentilactobacillus buchneri ATCC 11577]